MTYPFPSKQLVFAAGAAALTALAGAAAAQTPGALDHAYLQDSRGAVPVSAYGLCWQTGYGPKVEHLQCDPAKPVAATPPPPPAPVAAAAPPPSRPLAQKIALDAETLFDFDKAELRPEGRAALDEVAAKIKDVSIEAIIAVGHTDRIGTDRYNQGLSQRRANAVGSYLMSKGVDSNRIRAEGKGESQPVTTNCKGMTNLKLIACLQPDRRVEVEIIGTKLVMSK